MKLLFILIFLTSCALQDFLVSQADTYIESKISDKLGLYLNQKKTLDSDVDHFLNQQKQTAQKILETIKSINLKDESLVKEHWLLVNSYYQIIAHDFSILLTDKILLLDKKQQTEFFKKLNIENDEISKKTEETTTSDYEERMEFFFDRVTKDQTKKIKQHLSFLKQRNMSRVERRIELQKQLKIILADETDSAKKEKLIQAFDNYNQTSIVNQEELFNFVKIMIASLDQEQISYFEQKSLKAQELLTTFIKTKY